MADHRPLDPDPAPHEGARQSDGRDPEEGRGNRPTQESVLTPEDVRLLAQAIRQGTAAPPPTGGEVIADVVKLVVVLCLLLAVYQGLHRWHPDVAATYGGTTAGTLQSLTLRGGGHGVSWSVPGVYATTVSLAGPANEDARVELPILAQNCQLLASHLGLPCRGGVLVESRPVSLSWSSPQLLYLVPKALSGVTLAGQESTTVSLAVAPVVPSGVSGRPSGSAAADVPLRQSIALSVSGAGPLEWCYATPTANAMLTIRSGQSTFVVPSSDIRAVGCGAGLTLDVLGDDQFSDQRPPEMTFGKITSFTFQATSLEVEAQDLGGTLHLGEAGTDSFSPAAQVDLATHGQSTIHAVLALDTNRDDLSLTSPRLADASTGGIQLIDSWWDRENSISVPLFLAACATPLALLPALFDKSWRWRRSKRTPDDLGGSRP
jgi:hypothetical protein